MSSLATKPHTPECRSVKEDWFTVYVCSATCPAMSAYLVQPGETTGEVDDAPDLTEEQVASAVEILKNMDITQDLLKESP
jgi:hypothetical protein